MMPSVDQSTPALAVARQIIEDAWVELRTSFAVRRLMRLQLENLPDLSFDEAARRGVIGNGLLDRIDQVSWADLPHDVALTLRVVRFRANIWSKEADWYWSAVSPQGAGGIFGMFLPTAYCGGLLLNAANGELGRFQFRSRSDCDHYRDLVVQYAAMTEQFARRTAAQAALGMRMPRPQCHLAKRMLTDFRDRAVGALRVTNDRLEPSISPGFNDGLERLIENAVMPAFEAAIATFSDDYITSAPESVGMGQYPDGERVYRELVGLHTTLPLSPERLHETGLDRLADISKELEKLRSVLGFQDNEGVERGLAADPRWRDGDAAKISGRFQTYIDRANSAIAPHFATLPAARCHAAALPEALEGSMTYGYYDASELPNGVGRYLFNARNLREQPLHQLASLSYHELLPGHHLHLALQGENEALHPVRKYTFINAFNEGWAEYAATFADELGLYHEPEEKFGRLMLEAMLTTRLVVDTGMNAFGWSLDKARDFMLRESGLNGREIESESLRYSCDIPAQALAYKIGDREIFKLRSKMQGALGRGFDLKTFHTSVLAEGALPLDDLAWHVDRQTRVAAEKNGR